MWPGAGYVTSLSLGVSHLWNGNMNSVHLRGAIVRRMWHNLQKVLKPTVYTSQWLFPQLWSYRIIILKRMRFYNGTKWLLFHCNIWLLYAAYLDLYVITVLNTMFSVLCHFTLQHVRSCCNMSKWFNSLAVCHKYDRALIIGPTRPAFNACWTYQWGFLGVRWHAELL